MQWGIADFNAATATRIEEFKTHLAPSLTPLLASNAANTTINTIEKSAVSHFLVSYFPFLLLVTPKKYGSSCAMKILYGNPVQSVSQSNCIQEMAVIL